MAEIINLRTARKARARTAAQTEAAANRALHGRTPTQKAAEHETQARRDRLLDGARRDPED